MMITTPKPSWKVKGSARIRAATSPEAGIENEMPRHGPDRYAEPGKTRSGSPTAPVQKGVEKRSDEAKAPVKVPGFKNQGEGKSTKLPTSICSPTSIITFLLALTIRLTQSVAPARHGHDPQSPIPSMALSPVCLGT